MDSITRANKELDRVYSEHASIVYTVAAYVFWHEYGWRKNRISKVFSQSQEVYSECAGYGVEKSMIQMLDEETGIEIGIPGKKSYKELSYLNGTIWEGKPPTKMQLIYIRKQEAEWCAPVMIACLALALHRKDGWGSERIAKFVTSVQEIRFKYGNKYKSYKHLLDGVDIDKELVFDGVMKV